MCWGEGDFPLMELPVSASKTTPQARGGIHGTKARAGHTDSSGLKSTAPRTALPQLRPLEARNPHPETVRSFRNANINTLNCISYYVPGMVDRHGSWPCPWDWSPVGKMDTVRERRIPRTCRRGGHSAQPNKPSVDPVSRGDKREKFQVLGRSRTH